MKTCNDCDHARFVAGNLKARLCRGAPPQVVLIPAPPPNREHQIQYLFPMVEPATEACGMFKPRPNVFDIRTGKPLQFNPDVGVVADREPAKA